MSHVLPHVLLIFPKIKSHRLLHGMSYIYYFCRYSFLNPKNKDTAIQWGNDNQKHQLFKKKKKKTPGDFQFTKGQKYGQQK